MGDCARLCDLFRDCTGAEYAGDRRARGWRECDSREGAESDYEGTDWAGAGYEAGGSIGDADTDDRGQFEFKFPLQEGGAVSVGGTGATVTNSRRGMTHMLLARKPGYLQSGRNGRLLTARLGQSGVTIYLVPEALIVGHVTVPGSEGDVRIECELIKREVRDGQEIWSPARTFTTWADGEFRFSELEAGTYKLITHEQMDRDSLPPVPGAQLFGYPPIYYQNTTDFSAASAIEVKAGEIAQANLTVARREYHPVRIAVTNDP
jgi:hypothetical protein